MSEGGNTSDKYDTKTPITWNSNLEDYLCDTAEKAECLSWIHKRAEELYSRRKTFIDLPVIALSSIVGFCSVGSSNIFGVDNIATSSILLGGISLFVSVLNTTGSYFGWAKRSEGHRVSSIHYAKMYRFLKVELALPREERMIPNNLLKYCREQYDRLQEVSPLVPEIVALEFKRKFNKYKDIAKPEEMNGLSAVNAFTDIPTGPIPAISIDSPGGPAPSPVSDDSKARFNPKQAVVDQVINAIETSRRNSSFPLNPIREEGT